MAPGALLEDGEYNSWLVPQDGPTHLERPSIDTMRVSCRLRGARHSCSLLNLKRSFTFLTAIRCKVFQVVVVGLGSTSPISQEPFHWPHENIASIYEHCGSGSTHQGITTIVSNRSPFKENYIARISTKSHHSGVRKSIKVVTDAVTHWVIVQPHMVRHEPVEDR